MDDRDELIRQYLSTQRLTTPPEEVTPSTGVSSVSTGDSANTDGPETESTPGNAKAEQVKDDGYANAADDSAVKAAQQGRDRADLISNVGRSLSQIFTARAQANGYKPDNSVYDSIAKSGQMGVDEAQRARQDAITAYLNKNKLAHQQFEEGLATKADTRAGESHGLQMQQGQQALDQGAARFTQEQKGYELTNEANDPTSQKSRMAQHLFSKALGSEYAADLAGMSANDINQYAAKPLELKAQIDARKLQAQQAYDLKRGDKQREADTAFTGRFNTLSQAHSKAAAELDKQEDLIRQASQSNGGIAGNLVKGGALHEALGRVSQGELGMAVDPSIAERAKRLWGSITEGKSLTDKDVQEFKNIMGGARQSLDAKFGADAEQMLGSYDRAQRREPGYGAGLVGWKGVPQHAPVVDGGQAPAPKAPAVGDVDSGYRFKGGDPSKKENWEAVP